MQRKPLFFIALCLGWLLLPSNPGFTQVIPGQSSDSTGQQVEQCVESARQLMREERYSEAREQLERARSLSQNAPPVWVLFETGNLCFLQGQFPEAQANFKQALPLFYGLEAVPHGAIGHALAQLGFIAQQQGQTVQAASYYNQSLKHLDLSKDASAQTLQAVRQNLALLTAPVDSPETVTPEPVDMRTQKASQAEIDAELSGLRTMTPPPLQKPEVPQLAMSPTPLIPVSPKTESTSTSPDYFHLQTKKIVRWHDETHFIMVHIMSGENLPGWQPENVETVKAAFLEWQHALDNRVQFVFMPDLKNVDVRVFWRRNSFLNDQKQEVTGFNSKMTWGKYTAKNDIDLSLHNLKGQLESPAVLQTVALHEIGHMLGIGTHSDDPKDIMYPSVETTSLQTPSHLTARDINTMKLIYAKKASITNPKDTRLSQFESFKKRKGSGHILLVPLPLPVPIPVPIPIPF